MFEFSSSAREQVSVCASACLHVIQELSLLLETAVWKCNSIRLFKPPHIEHFQNGAETERDQESGVLEEERRWQNLLAQSPSKGEFEFEEGDVML
jgi:hypothetical protein